MRRLRSPIVESSDFIEIVDELARRLEGPAKHVFELAVRQVYVELFLYLALLVGFLVVVIPLAKYAKSKSFDTLDMNFAAVMALSFGAIAVVPAFVFAVLAVAAALNPEWRAIEMIATAVLG